jgi:hypothetical protein
MTKLPRSGRVRTTCNETAAGLARARRPIRVACRRSVNSYAMLGRPMSLLPDAVTDKPRAVVLVEGISEKVALEAPHRLCPMSGFVT